MSSGEPTQARIQEVIPLLIDVQTNLDRDISLETFRTAIRILAVSLSSLLFARGRRDPETAR